MSTPIHCNTSQTEIKLEKVCHEWTVKNFSHCYQEYLETYVKLNKGDDILVWSVKIYPRGNGENNKEFVFLCLNRLAPQSNGKFGKVGFKSRFIMQNADHKAIDVRVHPNPSHSDYVSYIKRDVLFPQILPQDRIIVTVEIDVAVETVTTTSEDSTIIPDASCQLVIDYDTLLRNQMFSDFIIEVGGKSISVHRNILAARSSVFAAMLTHDTEESQKGKLTIKDMDFDVALEMINYMYSGRCDKIGELGADLLVAADKYSLPDLKLRCEKALISVLNVENACDLLIMADTHSASRLKERAITFFVTHSSPITQTAGWQMILRQRPDLITEVVRSLVNSRAETEMRS